MKTVIKPRTKEPAATNPEIELLLCCSRTCISTETAEKIRKLLQQNINWTYLIEIASGNGVIPLLYQNLKTSCPEAVPKTILTQLRSYFHANALHNLFLTQELVKLLALLGEHNIRAIPFKGPVLAVSAYGNLALRQFTDLDILVQEMDYAKAKQLLMAEGYSMLYDSEHERKYLQAQLWNIERQVNVDLHYGIPPRELHLDTEEFWQHLQPFSLHGTNILALSPEDHLLLLCINGYKHTWQKLSDICNIAGIIGNYPKMDWKRLLGQAERWRIRRILYLPLLLTRDMLETPLPEEILSAVTDDRVIKWLSSKLSKNCLLKNDGLISDASSAPSYLWTTAVYNLLISEYKHNGIFYWLTPNLEDREFLKIPSSISWLYYLLRPIRLINKYGFVPVRYLFKRLLQGRLR
jgi:hypothetical protein